jgi:hypothetical protein
MGDVKQQPPNPAGDGTKVPVVPLKNRYLAAFLAYLVPGLGHAYQGRYGKAFLYFVCIGFLFVVGMTLGDGKILYWRWVNPLADAERFCFWYFAQFFAGIAALPALIQATLTQYGLPTILWGYGADPAPELLNGLYPRYGKLVEIGYIYTEAAGLLNILAIFDAYEGPAVRDESPEPAPKTETPEPTPATEVAL